MTLNALIKLINDNLQNGPGDTKFLVLSQAIDPVFGELVSYLHLSPSQLQLNDAKVSSNAMQVQVSGNAYFLHSNNVVVLTGRVVNQQALLQLTGIPDPPAAWNFTVSFPDLPQYYTTEDMFMKWKDSFFPGLVFSSPVFTLSTYDDTNNRISQGLNFRASLAIDGPLKNIPIVSALQGPLSVAGTIGLSNALEPQISLAASIPSISFSLGTVSLNRIRLLLEARTGDTLNKRFPGERDEVDEHAYYSAIEMEGHVMIGALDVTISTPLLQGDFVWPFKALFPRDTLRLNDGLAQLVSLVSGSSFVIPEPISKWTNFYLSAVEVGIDPSDVSVNFISVTVSSPETYDPPVPKLKITDISIQWLFTFPTDPANLNISGTLSGTFAFGSAPPVRLDTSLTIPDFEILCVLREGDVIKVTDAFTWYFGYSGSLPQANITALRILTQLDLSNFVFYGQVDLGWQITIGTVTLSLEQLIAEINYGSSVWSGKISAIWMLNTARFLLSAENRRSGDWAFRGEQYPGDVISLGAIITEFLSFTPGLLPELNVEGMAIWFETGDQTLGFKGQTAGFWTYEISSDITLRMKASVFFERKQNLPYSGKISGVFMINDLLLGATYAFEKDSTTLIFLLKYKKLELTATLTSKLIAKTQTRQSILTIGFGDMSLGDIITWLVGIANPRVQVTLEGPWSVLYDINFKNLSITVNLDTKEVGIWYAVGIDLVFASVEAIGLLYKKEKGKGRVMVQIKGRFLDQSFGEDDPLEWDLLEDSPPEIPGKESAFLEIRFVGIGQHVAIDRPTALKSVEEVINALRDQMLPPGHTDDNPLQDLHGLVFDENSHWLFGLDMTLIGAVRLAVVFNDPYLYGLLVELSGARVGSLAGLKFEVLYVRITDDIGVFKIELRVPSAFRQLEFGAVSVTLPVIRLEIYTNGNFKVDLGFPKERDFTDSFCIQVFPFIGYGGIYFAWLTGATSQRVPAITNGVFNPVIEFGFGLSVGLGKTIEKGPFKAGLSITVVGILQGALAWFNPNDKSLPAPMYYWLQGTIAIVGKLYGEVDFKIIAVRVSVEAYASATLTIEAYSPIYIQLKVGVKVKASVEFLFFTVHFSYSVELNEEFTIGTRKPAPWITASPASGQPSLRLQRRGVRPLEELRLSVAARARQAHDGRRYRLGLLAAPVLSWNPSLQVFSSVEPVHFTLAPFFTVALSGGAPAVQVVMTLTTENTIAPAARNAADVKMVTTAHSARTDDPAESPFNMLVQAMLAYALDAFPREDKTIIQAGDLQQLYDLMQQSDTEDQGFGYTNLSTFLQTNFIFMVSGLPQPGSQPSPTPPSGTSVAVIPMIPEFIMAYSGTTVNFKEGPYMVDQQYEDDIAAYFKQLGVGYLDNVAKDPLRPSQDSAQGAVAGGMAGAGGVAGGVAAAGDESIATMVFRDYFLMVARAAVQEAINLLEAYPYAVQPGDSLSGIAGNPVFPKLQFDYEVQMGDTWQSVAAHFGMTVQRLQQLNPGVPPAGPLTPPLDLVVEAGVTVGEIAAANSDKALAGSVPLVLSGINYQVRSGQQLGTIAGVFGHSAADLSTFNATATGILQEGQQLLIAQPPVVNGAYSQFTYTTVQGDTLPLIAAGFLTRNNDPNGPSTLLDPVLLQWYGQTIADLNPTADLSPAPGTVLVIPGAYLNSSTADAVSYTTRGWDTLDLIAGYFTLEQNPTTPLTDYSTAIRNLNPTVDWNHLAPNTALNIPALQRRIQGNDRFSSVGALYGISAADLGTVNASSGTVLTPLAVLAIPPVAYTTAAGDTMAGLAGTYNLTIEQLAVDIAGVGGIFPVPDTLTIPAVPAIAVSRILSDVVTNGHSNNIAAMTSRFLLHGLRLPVPSSDLAPDPNTPLEGLYLLTGQQFAAPADTTQNYTIQFSIATGVSWIEFANSYTVQPGDTEASLQQTYPDIVALNPGTDWSQLTPGMVLLTSLLPAGGNLPIVVTPAIMAANYPSVTFKPVFDDPVAAKLYNEHPVRYTLQDYLHWQAPIAIVFPLAPALPPAPPPPPPPKAGEPGIWVFPPALTEQLAQGQWGRRNFELAYLTGREENFDEPSKPAYYLWAVLLSIDISTIADAANPGSVLANTYECKGADEANRQLLLQVWSYLEDNADTADIQLLYPPNATSGNPAGLSSGTIDGANTFILKTNLSTTTTSGAVRAMPHAYAAVVTDNYRADISDPKSFLQFLWEGAITGTGGYYLTYTNGVSGDGLPANIFDQSGNGQLWLAITLHSQADPANPGYRMLQPFNNCAIVGDNLDPATINLFIEVADGSDTVRVASVQPGNTGFDMTMADPVPQVPIIPDPELRTRILYSMLGYQVAGAGPFVASNQGLPVGPLEQDNDDPAQPWYFHQTIPIAKLATIHSLPACAALPDPAKDPYAGIVISNGQLGKATLNLAFYDVFGNSLQPDPAHPLVSPDLPIGYFDDVIGLSQWPGLSASYLFSEDLPTNPFLHIYLSFHTENYIPGPGLSFDAAAYNSSAHWERYKQVYYQMQQPDLAFMASTSIVQTNQADTVYAVNKGGVLGLVNAACVFLNTTQHLSKGQHLIVTNDTLQLISGAYTVSYEALAGANSDAKVVDLFLNTLTVPYYFVTGRGESLNTVVAAANAGSPPSPVTAVGIVTNNLGALLGDQLSLTAPSRTVTLSSDPAVVAALSLGKIASQQHCSVAGLANANAQPTPAIITQGILLTLDGLQYTTGVNDSLVNITAQFNAMGSSVNETGVAPYTIDDVAVANQDVLNLFVAGATLTIGDYLTAGGDSFYSIGVLYPGYTPAALLAYPENLALVNLYTQGQAILMYSRPQQPLPNDTVASFAASWDITPEQLFGQNGTTPLQTASHGGPGVNTNVFVIPALASLDPAAVAGCYVPYSTKQGDSLSGIATLFYGNAAFVLQLATLNLQVGWLFVPGQDITVGAHTVQTQASDSMQAIITRFFQQYGVTVTLQALLDQIQGSTGLLAEGAFLACPLPNTGASGTLAGLSQQYNVPVTAIAAANSSVQGFLATTGTMSVQRIQAGQPVEVSVSLQANDTFYTLVARFKVQRQIETTVDEIATYNKDRAILGASQLFLLPPDQLNISQSLGVNYPANPHYPGTIFEIKVDLTILRDKDNQGLINPDFTVVPAVKSSTTAIAPQSIYDATGQLSLTGFGVSFEKAFPNLKVAITNTGRDKSSNNLLRHIWAVYFGANGIAKFDIDKLDPHYYALRPLSTSLISRSNVPVMGYAGGELTGTDNHNFQSVDMEVWARQFLDAVEQFLTPAWANAASQLPDSGNGFNRVMAAKKTLAGKIAAGLDYILDVTRDETKLSKAQEALKDQLLINLAKAYQTDALLQYDIDIEASFADQPVAPRLSGKAVSNQYHTYPAGQAGNNTIAQISSDLGVSAIYFAAAVAGLGVLNTGLSVSYPAQPGYTIAAGDTLNDLAAHFQATLQDIIDHLSWSNPTTQGLFMADITIPVTSVRLVTGTRTIAAIATYFNQSVEEWATANQDNSNLFQVGKVISYPGHTPVTVNAGNNTLGKIAAALGAPSVLPGDLAESLQTQTDLLNPQFISYMLVSSLNYSISTAKTSLATGTSEANFMLNILTGDKHRKALLSLDYIIDELEFNIASVDGVQDYQSSSWLSFLIPIASGQQVIDGSLGQPEIPLPLRSFPAAPTLLEQSGVASVSDVNIPGQYPANVDQAKLWKYSFSYLHTDAEQDTGYLHVRFGLDETANTRLLRQQDGPDLFASLAQFVSVWPALSGDLALLPNGVATPELARAVGTFATLVEGVAGAWGYVQNNALKRGLVAVEDYRYTLSGITILNGDGVLVWKTLVLTPLQTAVSPTGVYPDIYWVDRSTDPATEYQLEKVPGATNCIYTYPVEKALASMPTEHRFVFDSVNLIQYPNALAGAYVTRNAYLVERKTNDSLIFRTPEIVFNQTLFPLVEHDVPMPFRVNQADLRTALQGLFTELLGTSTPPVKITALYGYTLVGAERPEDAIVSLLPIVFRPMTVFDSTVIDNLTTVIGNWIQGKTISQAGARYSLDLCVFTDSSARPLLRLKNLVWYF